MRAAKSLCTIPQCGFGSPEARSMFRVHRAQELAGEPHTRLGRIVRPTTKSSKKLFSCTFRTPLNMLRASGACYSLRNRAKRLRWILLFGLIVGVTASSAQSLRTLTARELWRAGGDDDTRIFGVITRVIEDSTGKIYFLDSQLSEVQVYSPAGEFLGTLSREGDGPGEVRRPTDACWLPNGLLALAQPYPGNVVTLDRDGKPRDIITYGAAADGFCVLLRALGNGRHFALGGISMTFSQTGSSAETRFLSFCESNGSEMHRVFEECRTVDYSNYVLEERTQDFIWERCDLGPTGHLYVAPERNEYRIEVYDPRGERTRVITREYQSLERSQALREAARRRMEAYLRFIPGAHKEPTIEDTEPDITNLRVTPDGRLWVRTSRGDRENRPGILTTFDRFALDGTFREQVALECPGSLRRDEIYLLSHERLIRVIGGVDAALTQQGVSPGDDTDETPLEIVCYDISS